MNNFFKTLLTWNWANVGKFASGIAVAVLSAVAAGAIPGVPVLLIELAPYLATAIGGGVVLGIHGVHTADPPGKISLPIGALDPSEVVK